MTTTPFENILFFRPEMSIKINKMINLSFMHSHFSNFKFGRIKKVQALMSKNNKILEIYSGLKTYFFKVHY